MLLSYNTRSRTTVTVGDGDMLGGVRFVRALLRPSAKPGPKKILDKSAARCVKSMFFGERVGAGGMTRAWRQ